MPTISHARRKFRVFYRMFTYQFIPSSFWHQIGPGKRQQDASYSVILYFEVSSTQDDT